MRTTEHTVLSWKSTETKMMWYSVALIVLLGCLRVSVRELRNVDDDLSFGKSGATTALSSRDEIPYHIKSACESDLNQLCLPPLSIDEIQDMKLSQHQICNMVVGYQMTKYLYQNNRHIARSSHSSIVCDRGNIFENRSAENMNATAVQSSMVELFRSLFLKRSNSPVCSKPRRGTWGLADAPSSDDSRVVFQDGPNSHKIEIYYDGSSYWQDYAGSHNQCIATIASLRSLLLDPNTYQDLNVTISLGNLPLLGYNKELVDEAIDLAAQAIISPSELDRFAEEDYSVSGEEVSYIMQHFRETQFPQRTPLASASFGFLGNRNRRDITCLRSQYNNNQRLMPSCEAMLEQVAERFHEFEFRTGFPLAQFTFYVYLVLFLVAMYRLHLPLGGMPETAEARKRRKFLQMLRDPILRGHTQRKAELRGEPDIEQYMAQLDARGQQLIQEGVMTDEEWKHNAVKEVAWKRTLSFMWNVRRACLGATLFSFAIFLFDKGADSLDLLDRLLVVAFTLLGTFLCLPKSPMKQSESEMVVLGSAAEPLLEKPSSNA